MGTLTVQRAELVYNEGGIYNQRGNILKPLGANGILKPGTPERNMRLRTQMPSSRLQALGVVGYHVYQLNEVQRRM